jgi:hypothetical protein
LQTIWGVIRLMSMIVHFPLINVPIPANALAFLRLIIDIASFDILPSEKLNKFIFSFPEEDSIQPWQFQVLGYESKYSI